MVANKPEKLYELAGRWQKNRDAIGYTCSLEVKGQKITYSFSDCPKKYRVSLTKLTDRLLKEGMAFIADAFSYPVKDETEMTKVQKYLSDHMSSYLATLLGKGYDAFEHSVTSDAKILQFSSVASSLTNEGGTWKNWKGEELDPDSGCWVTKGGESVSDSASIALWGILADGNRSKKKRFHAV